MNLYRELREGFTRVLGCEHITWCFFSKILNDIVEDKPYDV
jgi:hypothetical protein